MFNTGIGSLELLLILIVALLVLGPEKLPGAVRTTGLWVGRFRRSFYKVKAEIERELNADEIRRQLHNESVMAEIEEAKSEIEGIAKETEKSVNTIVNSKTFDPGAAKESLGLNEEEKNIADGLKEAGEQVEEVSKQLYGTGKNPKLAQESSNSEVSDKENDIS